VAVLTSEEKVEIWSPTTPSSKMLPTDNTKINAIAFNPTGQVLVTGGEDGSVKIWDTDSGSVMQVLPRAEPPEGGAVPAIGAVSDLAFNADGRSIAISRKNGTLQRWVFTNSEPLLSSVTKGDFSRVSFGSYGALVALEAEGTAV